LKDALGARALKDALGARALKDALGARALAEIAGQAFSLMTVAPSACARTAIASRNGPRREAAGVP
jgi:hypothetical protein